MSYRSIHEANERFGLGVILLLVAAFVIAAVLMFIHPTASLMLFFLALLFLAAVGIAEKFIHRAERLAAKSELEHHVCPECGSRIEQDHTNGLWHCAACSVTFQSTGLRSLET